MATEITVLDFKLSNTFSEYCTNMNALEQQKMFREVGVKTFYIGECRGDSKRQTVMFEGLKNILYNIFVSPETKPIVETSGQIYEETKITRWINNCLTAKFNVLKIVKKFYLKS